MKPWETDSQGRPMYPRTRATVLRYAAGLVDSGFRQSTSKPWLFVRDTPHGAVFANLGGTAVIPIWEDMRPMLHHQLRAPRWLIRKTLKQTENELDAHEIPYRYSFYQTDEPGGLWFPVPGAEPVDPADGDSAPDGNCHRCGADLLSGRLYCETCETIREEYTRLQCAACRDLFVLSDTVVHHISYDPEFTVRVCRSCYLRIHRSELYPKLKPRDRPKEL